MKLDISAYSITYIFIMPEIEKSDLGSQSPFQGFLFDLVSSPYAAMISKLLICPHSIDEVTLNKEELLSKRKGAVEQLVFLLSPSAIESKEMLFQNPLTVIAYDKKYQSFYEGIRSRFVYEPIVITNNTKMNQAFQFDQIVDAYSIDHVLYERFINFLNSVGNLDLKGRFKAKKLRLKYQYKDAPIYNHGVTNSNDLVLSSLGVVGKLEDLENASKEKFISSLIDGANYISKLKVSEKSGNTDMILFVPAMFSYLYDIKNNIWNKLFREVKSKNAKEFIIKSIIRNPDYSSFTFKATGDKGLKSILSHKFTQSAVTIRRQELHLSTLATALISVAHFIPTIRLPNNLNFSYSLLNEIESHSKRGDLKGRSLLKKRVKELIIEWKSIIGKDLLTYINSEASNLKLCTDIPLEWITLDCVPIMISHKISKIPVTPGNLFLNQSSFNIDVLTSATELRKILIIRSFSPHDPIKPELENTIKSSVSNIEYIEVVDVSSSAELVDAINNFSGHIVIFDCHGNHGGRSSNGWLQIGKEQVDVWSLPITSPLIVILSACMTSSIAGSHASVTNGFIQKGSYSVLGTYLPVDAYKSASLVSNLITNIFKTLSTLKQFGVVETTWQNILYMAICESYMVEVFNELLKKFGDVDSESLKKVLELARTKIYSLEQTWHISYFKELSQLFSIELDCLHEFIHDDLVIVESMYYSQFGKAENIRVIL